MTLETIQRRQFNDPDRVAVQDRDGGTEGVQELLVVGEEDDQFIAALSALRLQVMEDSERARMHFAEAYAALRIFALDIRYGAIDVAVAVENVRKRRVFHRMCTVIRILERGRRLICASSSTGSSFNSRSRKRRAMRLTCTSISNIAMFSPMQCRGPTEKGIYAKRWRSFASMPAKRAG